MSDYHWMINSLRTSKQNKINMVVVNTYGMIFDHISSTELNYNFTFVDSITLISDLRG